MQGLWREIANISLREWVFLAFKHGVCWSAEDIWLYHSQTPLDKYPARKSEGVICHLQAYLLKSNTLDPEKPTFSSVIL